MLIGFQSQVPTKWYLGCTKDHQGDVRKDIRPHARGLISSKWIREAPFFAVEDAMLISKIHLVPALNCRHGRCVSQSQQGR